jgi:hypothetical protein
VLPGAALVSQINVYPLSGFDGSMKPAPAGEDSSLYLRTYWPDQLILDGQWTPPPVKPI